MLVLKQSAGSSRLLPAVLVAAGIAAPAAAAVPDPSADLQSRLISELRAAHPEIERWEVRAVGPADGPAEEALSGDLTILDVRLGRRSAVVVAGRDAMGRPARQSRWFAVAGLRTTLVAHTALARGATPDAASVTLQQPDLLERACEPVTDVAGLAQWRLRRAVSAGEPLCRELLVPRLSVSRGDSVAVRYTTGVVDIQTVAEAQEDGVIGEVVRVRNPLSREAYEAVVVGTREVLVRD